MLLWDRADCRTPLLVASARTTGWRLRICGGTDSEPTSLHYDCKSGRARYHLPRQRHLPPRSAGIRRTQGTISCSTGQSPARLRQSAKQIPLLAPCNAMTSCRRQARQHVRTMCDDLDRSNDGQARRLKASAGTSNGAWWRHSRHYSKLKETHTGDQLSFTARFTAFPRKVCGLSQPARPRNTDIWRYLTPDFVTKSQAK